VPEPDPRRLVAGELFVSDLAAGRIRWRFGPDELQDWIAEQGWHRLPLRFTGAHAIRLRAPAAATAGEPVELALCRDGDRALLVRFRPLQHRDRLTLQAIAVVATSGGSETVLAELAEHPCGSEGGLALSLRLRGEELTLGCARGEILRLRLAGPIAGGFAMRGLRFEQLEIEGQIEPAWLQGRVDAEREQLRLRFRREFDARALLPGWMFELPPRPDEGLADRAEQRLRPDPLRGDQVATVERLEAELARGAAARVEAELDDCPEMLPAATERLLRAQIALVRGEPAAALEQLAGVPAAQAAHSALVRTQARALAALGRRAEARERIEQLIRRQPGVAEHRVELASLWLDDGEIEVAHQIVTRARAEGATSRALLGFARMLDLAAQGPSWARTSRFESTHFELRSDLDAAICADAARELEALRTRFEHRLQRLPARAQRFRVYLFSGERGYQEHLRRLLGPGLAVHTQGMHVRALRQMFVWNLSAREQTWEAIRHEGVHQLLGEALADPPRWLDEGLAVYFERTGDALGAPREDLLARLRAEPAIPLAELLQQQDAQFFAGGERSYAQAWAFVHLLLHGAPEHRATFDALWRALAAGARGRAAVERTLLPRLEQLERDLAAHLARLG
jgi:hypothetical protein